MRRLIVFVGLLLISCGGGDDDGGTTGGSSTIKTTDSKQDEAGMGDDKHDEKVAEVPDTPDTSDQPTFSLSCSGDPECGSDVTAGSRMELCVTAALTPLTKSGRHEIWDFFHDGILVSSDSGTNNWNDNPVQPNMCLRPGYTANGLFGVSELRIRATIQPSYVSEGKVCECRYNVVNSQKEESEQ